MKNLLLYPNPIKDSELIVTRQTAEYLCHLGFTVYISDKFSVDHCETYHDTPPSCDAMIVIGGDGSMIDALPLALTMDIPVLGINLGKVGFLNELEPTEISLLEQLKLNNYTVDQRLLMDVEVVEGQRRFYSAFPAVNDLVVSRKIENTIASVRVYYNGTKALDYRADGVVISTPIGSSAYALSCGGPMLTHELDAISLTPICPHSFLNRSMVFPDSAVIDIENLGEHSLAVIVDGRVLTEISCGGICTLRKSAKTLKMISLKGEGHLQSIFKKLRKIQNF